MPGNHASPQSSVVRATYHSIEEVNEVLGTAGWDGEFRQLGRGLITGRWWSLHLGPSSLISHRLDNRIHVRQVPPRGCVALAIPPSPHSLMVNGVEAGSNDMIVVHEDAEAEIVTPKEAFCDTLSVPRSVFQASARALFPRMNIEDEPTGVLRCDPSGRSALEREMRFLLRDGRVTAEDLSNLLSRFLELMAGESGNRLGEKSLGNGSTHRVAQRAQDYIEEWYTHTIRMEDLCRYTGVSLRTLQRSFAHYFQMSPSEFIRARRLNAARRSLLAADSSHHSVTQAAFGAGFTHLGRFSVEYREHFCELPRETLTKRAPRRGGSVGTG